MENSFKRGLKDGIPIALGYIAVSFSFGILASSNGVPVLITVLISLTNLTSAGQLAGLSVMIAHGSLFEIALTQLVINLRYALMSLSLSQKVDEKLGRASRAAMSFAVTDEIFAVSSTKNKAVGRRYFTGLAFLPYFGWALGTLLGAVAGNILPDMVTSALGIAIYGMFIAIFVPPAKKYKPVLKVVVLAIIVSCIFYWVPVLNQVSGGFTIIIATVVAAAFGAYFFPIKEDSDAE